MTHSLDMEVECVEGRWLIDAPWLDAPVEGETFEAAYEIALLARAKPTEK